MKSVTPHTLGIDAVSQGSLSEPLARRRGRLLMPSIWPLIWRCRSPSPSTEKIWNLTLEEPALTTRIVSIAITRKLLEPVDALHSRREPRPRRRPSERAPSLHETSRICLDPSDRNGLISGDASALHF